MPENIPKAPKKEMMTMQEDDSWRMPTEEEIETLIKEQEEIKKLAEGGNKEKTVKKENADIGEPTNEDTRWHVREPGQDER